MIRLPRFVIGLCGVGALAAGAIAGPVEVVLSTVPGEKSARVPGTAGAHFAADAVAPFGRPVASPGGQYWMMRTAIREAGELRAAVIVGSGAEVMGAVVTGHAAPGGGIFSSFSGDMSVTDAGRFVLHATVVGGRAAAAAVFHGDAGAAGLALERIDPAKAASLLEPLPEPEIPEMEPDDAAVWFLVEDLVTTPAGDWVVRGVDESGRQWIFRNGGVVAVSGEALTLNDEETEWFRDASGGAVFFSMQVNARGDVVVGGLAEGPGAAGEGVIVLNGQRVILRAGEGVGAGGLRIAAFVGDGAFLTDDGWYYFIADLSDGEGAVVGQGLLRTRVCKPDWDGQGGPNSRDVAAFIRSWASSVTGGSELADYNRDGVVNSADIAAFIADWMNSVRGECAG